jgi:hypothetical protein
MSDRDDASVHSLPTKRDPGDVNLITELPNAIRRGSFDGVEELLQYEGAVGIRFTYFFEREKAESTGVPPIALAGGLGHNAIIQLLDYGAKVDTANIGNGSTALHLAAEHGKLQTVQLLLEKGAWVNDVNDFKYTSFHYTCWEGHLDIAKLLLSKGAELEFLDKDGWDALAFACNRGNAHVVRWLLDLEIENDGSRRRMNRNRQCDKGWTPLSRANLEKHFDCAQMLLQDPEVDLTLRDEDGDSALSNAARQNVALFMLDIVQTKTYFPDDPVSMETCIATPFEFALIEKGFLSNFAQVLRHPRGLELAMYWAVANGSMPLAQQCLYY